MISPTLRDRLDYLGISDTVARGTDTGRAQGASLGLPSTGAGASIPAGPQIAQAAPPPPVDPLRMPSFGLYAGAADNVRDSYFAGGPAGTAGFVNPDPAAQLTEEDVALIQGADQAQKNAQRRASFDVDRFHWDNWSATQGFDQAPEARQRQLVQMFHDNVIPYAAKAMGEDPATHQNEFVARRPAEAAMMIEPDEFKQRKAIGEEMGLSGDALTSFVLTKKLPQSDKPDSFERRRVIAQEMGFTGREKAVFIATGNIPASKKNDPGVAERLAEFDASGLGDAYGPEARSVYGLTGRLPTQTRSSAANPPKDQLAENQRIWDALPEVAKEQFGEIGKARFLAEGKLPNEATRSRTQDPDGLTPAQRVKQDNEDKEKIEDTKAEIEELDRTFRNFEDDLDFVIEELKEAVAISKTTRLPVTGSFGEYIAKNAPLGSVAGDIRTKIDSAKGKIAFGELAKMRANSRNGASGLGQLTANELTLLTQAMGSVDPALPTYPAWLKNIQTVINRLEDTKKLSQSDRRERMDALNGLIGTAPDDDITGQYSTPVYGDRVDNVLNSLTPPPSSSSSFTASNGQTVRY